MNAGRSFARRNPLPPFAESCSFTCLNTADAAANGEDETLASGGAFSGDEDEVEDKRSCAAGDDDAAFATSDATELGSDSGARSTVGSPSDLAGDVGGDAYVGAYILLLVLPRPRSRSTSISALMGGGDIATRAISSSSSLFSSPLILSDS